MTTPEITRIRAALGADLKGWGNINTAWVTQLDDDGNEGLSIVGAVIDGEMYPVIEIDAAQYYAEDSGPKLAEFYAACNSAAMTAVLAHIDAQQAEIALLRADAARYQWLKRHPQWLGWEHDFRPDEVEREVDATMKETP